MPKKYDIRLTAIIEIGGVYEANSAEEARAAAELELRPCGEITALQFERCIYLDDPDEEDERPDYAFDPHGIE